MGSIPGWGTKTPQASGHSQKKKKMYLENSADSTPVSEVCFQFRPGSQRTSLSPPLLCDTDRLVISLTGNPVCGVGIVVFCCYFYLFARILQCEDDVKVKLPVTLQL